MRTSTKFIILQLVLFLSETLAAPLFGEYIGAEFDGVRFSDVPINPNVEFHFILAFAADYDTSASQPSVTDGTFNVFWDTQNLGPSDVSAIKSQHLKVKVALSLAGDTVHGSSVFFNPLSIDMWVSNAVTSLTSIIMQYNLDGIDINYEHFVKGYDTNMFSQCIGQLITVLKNNGVISFASIAPYDTVDVQKNYMALWKDYGSVIDYVNFQFYAYSSSTTVTQLQNYFNAQVNNYDGGKVLVSFSSAASAGVLTPNNGFFTVCSSLQSQKKLNGIFVWSADDSKAIGFRYETQAQTDSLGWLPLIGHEDFSPDQNHISLINHGLNHNESWKIVTYPASRVM